MKLRKIYNEITNHTSDIIFGILSGSGLIFITGAIIALTRIVFPTLNSYSTILYIAFYLFILLSTSIYFSRGWFRIIYLISASILLITQISIQIFGY